MAIIKNIIERITALSADQQKESGIPETYDPIWWDGLDDKNKKKIKKNMGAF